MFRRKLRCESGAAAGVEACGRVTAAKPVADKAAKLLGNGRSAGKTGRFDSCGIKKSGESLRLFDNKISSVCRRANTGKGSDREPVGDRNAEVFCNGRADGGDGNGL